MTRDTFNNTVSSLFEGLDKNFSTRQVIGDPVKVGETTIIPIIDLSFGMISGAFNGEKNSNSAGGVGVKARPQSVLVIKGDSVRLMDIGTRTGMDKLLDLVPDFVDMIRGKMGKKSDPEKEDKEAREAAKEEIEERVQKATESGSDEL